MKEEDEETKHFHDQKTRQNMHQSETFYRAVKKCCPLYNVKYCKHLLLNNISLCMK